MALITTQFAEIGGSTVTEQLNVPVLPAESVTVTVYGNVPLTVGVPEIVPPLDIVRPAGRPVAENVYGPPAPPLAVIVTGVIATPWMALITTQFAEIGGSTVTEQLNRQSVLAEHGTVTVQLT